MKPVALQNVTQPAPVEHVRYALSLGLPEFVPGLVRHDGTLVCVASGPSMPQFLDEIRQEEATGKPILAVKGAHDVLCEAGVIPDLYICVDPTQASHPAHQVTPNTVTTYLLASRCHPTMFDKLKGYKVLLFHSLSEQEPFEELHDKIQVGGGPTSGLRAITLGYCLGFRKFILYGYDSCLAADRKTKRCTGETTDRIMDVWVNGRQFWCNYALAEQAQYFQDYFTFMPDIHIEARGDGLIAAILEARQAIAA